MKRNTVKLLLTLCGVLAVGCCLDLILFTDMHTGFVTAGSVWLRYGALLALGLGAHGAAVAARKRAIAQEAVQPHPVVVRCKMLCLALSVVCAVCAGVGACRAVNQFSRPTTVFGIPESGALMQSLALGMRLYLALSMIVLCAFFALMAARETTLLPQRSMLRTMGLWGAFGLLLLPVLRYVENPATAHRVLLVVPIFAAVTGVWFLVQLVGLLCRPYTHAARASFFGAGLTAFAVATCAGLPQAVGLLLSGKGDWALLGNAELLGLLGVLGAVLTLENAD